MYALAINGSPRKGGNTEQLLKTVLSELKDADWEIELVVYIGKNKNSGNGNG
jgi:multimeric flavodoxin WrbA